MKEGLDAALRASPKVLERCEPKTGLGAIIRGMVLEAANEVTVSKMAIFGALSLYLDFINLFLMLLRLFGDRR